MTCDYKGCATPPREGFKKCEPHAKKIRDYAREYYRAKPRVQRGKYNWEAKLRWIYGLSREQYDEMLAAQGGVCAICEKECVSRRRLSVDHDHNTGQIRGLLCMNCNRSLGLLRDDAEVLRRAIVYLERGLVS